MNKDPSSPMDYPEAGYFYGYMGIVSALCFANIGAAYGTCISGVGICSMGITYPEKVIKSVIPVIMAGILGIYGLIVAVILKGNISNEYNLYSGYKHLAAGLCCGVSSLAAGIAIGKAGDAGVRALGQQDKIFVGMMLILIFAEAIGLYGLIISLILAASK